VFEFASEIFTMHDRQASCLVGNAEFSCYGLTVGAYPNKQCSLCTHFLPKCLALVTGKPSDSSNKLARESSR